MLRLGTCVDAAYGARQTVRSRTVGITIGVASAFFILITINVINSVLIHDQVQGCRSEVDVNSAAHRLRPVPLLRSPGERRLSP